MRAGCALSPRRAASVSSTTTIATSRQRRDDVLPDRQQPARRDQDRPADDGRRSPPRQRRLQQDRPRAQHEQRDRQGEGEPRDLVGDLAVPGDRVDLDLDARRDRARRREDQVVQVAEREARAQAVQPPVLLAREVQPPDAGGHDESARGECEQLGNVLALAERVDHRVRRGQQALAEQQQGEKTEPLGDVVRVPARALVRLRPHRHGELGRDEREEGPELPLLVEQVHAGEPQHLHDRRSRGRTAARSDAIRDRMPPPSATGPPSRAA